MPADRLFNRWLLSLLDFTCLAMVEKSFAFNLQPMAAFPTLLGPTDPLCIAGKVVVALPSYSSKSTNI
jgi:hypothetical protein